MSEYTKKTKELIVGFVKENEKLVNKIVPNVIIQIIIMFVPNWIIFGVGWNNKGQFGLSHFNDLKKIEKLNEFSLLDPVNIYVQTTCFMVQSLRSEIFFCGRLGGENDNAINKFKKLSFNDQNIENNNIIISNGYASAHCILAVYDYSNHFKLQIFGIGDDSCYQCGVDDNNQTFCKQPTFLTETTKYFETLVITQIETGGRHTLFLTNNGLVHALGDNEYCQCGINYDNDNNNKLIKSPKIIQSLSNVNIIKICCGEDHNLCLDSNNKLWGFGKHKLGQIGIKNNDNSNHIKIPTMNAYLKNAMIEQIQCGSHHSMVIDNVKNCYLFGLNIYGQIGIHQVFIPHLIQSIDSMKGISIRSGSLGNHHTLLLSESNQIISFGNNTYNQCSSINKSNRIFSPYLLSNNEINNNSNFLINKVIAGFCFSIQIKIILTIKLI